MKRATKTIAILVLALTLCVCAFALSACDPATGTQEGTKSVTVKIGDAILTAKTDSVYVSDLLSELLTDGKISKYETSGEGQAKYITAIGSLTPNPANQYVAIYHSIDDIAFKGTDWQTGAIIEKEVDGTKYYYSGVGVTSLPVQDGASYMFVLESF